MPHPSGTLSAFLRRDAFDMVMFGYVYGIRRGVHEGLPGLSEKRVVEHMSVSKALTLFAKEFGIPPEAFNLASQEQRYLRMVKEFHQDQRGKTEPTHSKA